MVYVPYNGNILGLSLAIFEYCGIKPSKVLSRIAANRCNRIVDDNDKFVFKIRKQLGNKRYALPYFISIR